MTTRLPKTIPDYAARKLAQLAVEIVPAIEQSVANGQPADVALAEIFRRHKEFGARDRRFLSDLVFSYFRWKGWTSGLRIEAACIMTYSLDAAAIHPAIERLQSAAGLSAFQPMPGASLAAKAAAVGLWLGKTGAMPLEELVPPWVSDSLSEPGFLGSLIDTFQQRPPTWLRLRRHHEQNVLQALTQAGVSFSSHSRLPGAAALIGNPSLRSLPDEVKSLFEVQDLASQCVGWICAPKPGEYWWDLCAGSGGKALHLADQMQDAGRILATDVRDSILRELQRRVRRSGFSIIAADRLPERPPESTFDGVLVDAPCSGLGTWSRNPDARWRTSAAIVETRAEEQLGLLHEAAPSVKSGGALVYSVCTITKKETSGVLDRFLSSNPAFKLEPVAHPLSGEPTPGIVQVWPWQGPCDGMFVARLRKG